MRNITRSNYTPHIGDYHNMVVHDPVLGKIWLFDCDGVFLDMSKTDVTVVDEYGESVDYAASQRLVTATNNRTTDIDTASHERDDALDHKIDQEVQTLEGTISGVDSRSWSRDQAITDDYTAKYQSLDNDIETLTRVTNGLTTDVENIERTAVFGVTVNQSDGAKIVLSVNDGGTTTNTQLRDAGSAQSGLMSAADYNQLQDNTVAIQHLQNSGLYRGSFDTLADAPTTTPDEAFIGGEIFQNDFIAVQHAEYEGQTGIARYRAAVDGSNVSYAFEAFIDEDIANFTEGNAGLIVGGTLDGSVGAKSDGTGEVVGWSTVKNDISTNAGNIGTLTTDLGNLTNRVGTAEGNITSLDTRMGTAEGNITGLTTRMGTAEGNITANGNAISVLQGKGVQATTDTTLNANTENLLTVKGMMRQWVDITQSGLPVSPDPDTFYYTVES